MKKLTPLIAVLFLFWGNPSSLHAQSNNDAIFEDYPWLVDIIDTNNCTDQSITVYQSRIFQYLYIDNGDGTGTLYFEDGTFYCTGSPTYDCLAAYNLSEVLATWTCEGVTNPPPNNNEINHSDDPIFTNFSWLTTLFDPANCTDDRVTIYQQGAFQYLLVNDQLYLQDGTSLCQNTANYDCVAAYNLGTSIYEWDCVNGGSGDLGNEEEEPTNPTADCSLNRGTIVFAPCGEGGESFVFIRTEGGQLYDLYYADGVVYQARNGQQVNFDFINADFASPCSNATQAIRVTCIEDIPNPPMTCAMETGTFFFRNCDDGTRFFFIETTDGRILDPYFDAGVSHNPLQGQRVNFDYVDAGNSPCTVAEKAVSITCLEVLDNTLPTGDCNNNRGEIFFEQCDDGTNYFFIRSSTGQIFDPYYAAGVSFQQYNGAQILFDFVPAGFTSPCSQAEQAINITCIEEIIPTEVDVSIPSDFENYDVIYRICRGNALEIPNLKRQVQCNCPPNPQGPCDNFPMNQWATWSGPDLVDNTSSVTVSPLSTATYEAEINAFFCGINGPSFAPIAKTTFLVIVDNSSNCELSNAINQSTFEVSGCQNDIVRIPAPNPNTCPVGTPTGNGAVEILNITQNYLEVRLLNNGSFSYTINQEEDPAGVSCPTAAYLYNVNLINCIGGDIEDQNIQTKVFDYRACIGDQMTLPIPASINCYADHILDNEEEAIQVLAMKSTSMDIRLLKSGHVSVSALGNEAGCANTSHLFSFVALPDCEQDGFAGNATSRNATKGNGFTVYPTLTTGTLTLELQDPSRAKQVTLYDVFGRILLSRSVSPTTAAQFLQLDIGAYDKGIYYVELDMGADKEIRRVVKQ